MRCMSVTISYKRRRGSDNFESFQPDRYLQVWSIEFANTRHGVIPFRKGRTNLFHVLFYMQSRILYEEDAIFLE